MLTTRYSTYQAEIVPAPFRGFVVISLQLFLNAGTVFATGANKAFADVTDSVGWKTVTGIQFVFPVRKYSAAGYLVHSVATLTYLPCSNNGVHLVYS